MFAEFHFIRPFWLMALIPVVVLAVLLLRYRRDASPWHSLIASHLQPMLLGSQLLMKKQPLALPFLLASWIVAAIALAGPSWQKLPQPAFALKKATVLVVDMSLSMRATDMVPDRLTQLRFHALDFSKQLAEGELALLSFAGDAFVISPLTPDHNNISLLIPDLRPEIMPVQGSNLLAALQQADKLLTQAGYPRGDVVVFTDGFDNNSYREIQDLLNNWPHRLSILGFGSQQGAPVKLENGELLKNAQGAVVLPKVPQQQLAALAHASHGVYANASVGAEGLKQILDLPPLSVSDNVDGLQQIKGDQWQDAAIYLVWLLLPLLLWQRRYSSLLSIGLVMLLPRPAEAFEWRDLWQTQQQQAEQDYQSGEFDTAQQKFRDPLWQGNAAYRAGNYPQAEQAFKQAAEQSDNASALYNLGNALAQQQRYQDALDAYQQALAKQPDLADAKQNADLMQQLLQQKNQQQQKQQGKKDKQDQNQQQSDDKSQQSDNSESQQDDNEQQNSNADQQQQQQNQQSANDAEQQQQQQADDQAQQQLPQDAMQQDGEQQADKDEQEKQAAIHEAWPDATPEQQQQLNNLLRKVQDDPALLLRNKMYLEYQKRQQQRLPKGVDQQW